MTISIKSRTWAVCKYFIVLTCMAAGFLSRGSLSNADAPPLLPTEEPVYHSGVNSIMTETFDDKRLQNLAIVNQSGRPVWAINQTITPEDEYQTDTINENGQLELGGARYFHRAVLMDDTYSIPNDYAMEFTVSIKRMSNAGTAERPMLAIIPRSKDGYMDQYYAVTYYAETTYYGNIVANLFKTKWAIVNTAAPSGMKPLAEGHFLLKENVEYTARLTIQNTDEGNVRIQFYLDGPSDPVSGYEPLLSYTDTSEYRILRGMTLPTFGTIGYANDIWGVPAVVRYDNIRLMDLPSYEKRAAWLKRFAALKPSDMEGHKLRNEIKYIINQGFMDVRPDGTFAPDQEATAGEFEAMLARWKSGYQPKSKAADGSAPLTKEQAASYVYELLGEPQVSYRYDKLLDPSIDPSSRRAVNYVFEKGLAGLEPDGRFDGKMPLSRADAALLMLRTVDSGYRLPHGSIQLPSVLASGAVLQRNKPIPIRGLGTSGDTITVAMHGQQKTTKVVEGKWQVDLDPEGAGGPYALTIRGVADEVVLEDIMIGEVFVVAGQSNAEMTMAEVNDTAATIERFLDKTSLRFYVPIKRIGVTPNYLNEGGWQPSLDWVLNGSPAIGTFFVDKLLELNPELDGVTIGIVQMTYGGSTIEVFLPNEVVKEQGYVQRPDDPLISAYWNGYMEAITPLEAKAMLYYQGENSTQLAYSYEPLLRGYLKAIRSKFRDSSMPVILVQLAGYGDNYYETDSDSWPIIREIQMRVANTTPHTGLVTAIDLADTNPLDIHPRDKKPIGERLAYTAMSMVYGRDLGNKSPVQTGYRVEGNRYIAEFAHMDAPKLVLRTGKPLGFEVMDESGRWIPAEALLQNGDREVAIWNDKVPNPKGARYGWRNYPHISLFDIAGLPALPFNTTKDSFKEEQSAIGTDGTHIRLMNHFLQTGDAIVNLTRGGAFRMVEATDAHLVTHVYEIKDQAKGDRIVKLVRLPNAAAEARTTETLIRLRNHGLRVGDWIRNNSQGWEARQVEAVIDADSFQVASIAGQHDGDELERFRSNGLAVALDSLSRK